VDTRRNTPEHVARLERRSEAIGLQNCKGSEDVLACLRIISIDCLYYLLYNQPSSSSLAIFFNCLRNSRNIGPSASLPSKETLMHYRIPFPSTNIKFFRKRILVLKLIHRFAMHNSMHVTSPNKLISICFILLSA
jgi:hypothetical protein